MTTAARGGAHAPLPVPARLPSLRAQLETVLALYEGLTQLYFGLIEARAATATAAARSALARQVQALRALLASEDGGLETLSGAHAARLRALPAFQTLLPASQQQPQQQQQPLPSLVASASSPTIPAVAAAIDTLDDVLSQLLVRSRQHAVNQRRINALVHTIDQRHSSLVGTIQRLAFLRDQTARLVKVGSEEEAAMTRAEKRPLAYDEILRYGRTLSQTTTAPPGFKLKLEDDEQPGEIKAGVDGAATAAAAAAADASAETSGNVESSDEPAPRKRPLLPDADADGADGQGDAMRPAMHIPPHLQDKLPFPSVDAMRRGASEARMPTWEQFCRGMPQEEHDGIKDEPQQSHEASMAQAPPPPATRAPHAVAPPPPKAPVDEDDDGFGLDLN